MHNGVHIYPYNKKYSLKKSRRALEGVWKRFVDILAREADIEGILLILMGFSLSRGAILQELFPFGTAFFTAAAFHRRSLIGPFILAASLGYITASLSGPQLLQLTTILFVLFILFHWVNYWNFWGTYTLPAVVFLVTATVKGLFLLLNGGFYLDGLLLLVFEGLFAAGLTHAYYAAFSSLSRVLKEKSPLSGEEMVCTMILAVSLLGSFKGLKFGALDAVGIVGGFMVLCAGLIGRSGLGASAGVITGLVPILTAAEAPNMVGLYAFSGLASGLLKGWGKLGAAAGFASAHFILLMYFIDESTIYAAVGEMALAVLLFILFPKGWLENIKGVVPYSSGYGRSAVRTEMILQKLKDLGQIFNELGRAFERTSFEGTSKDGGRENAHLMLKIVTSNVCHGCSLYKTCWERDIYRTYGEILKLFSLFEEGEEKIDNYKGILTRRCGRFTELKATVSCILEVCQVNSYWRKKLKESRGLVASQLYGVSEIISALVSRAEINKRREEDIENNLIKMLARSGIEVKDAAVYRLPSGFKCQLVKESCRGSMECTRHLLLLCEEALGCRLSRIRADCALKNNGPDCGIVFASKKQYDVELGTAQEAKGGSVVSGDSVDCVHLDSGKLALILSDGMGTGARAGQESGATVTLLKKLLETGFEQELALKTVNAALALRSPEETFSTVDLAMIDLYSGQADFLKIAAAPTLIKRRNDVEIITSSSLPIGILDTVDFELKSLSLEPGDIVVMISDGFLEVKRKSLKKEFWLVSELKRLNSKDPKSIADALLAKAKDLAGGCLPDDAAVVVARLIPHYYRD